MNKVFALALFIVNFSLNATALEMWISSFQDQVYYEKMAELYNNQNEKNLDLSVKAYGFREMPDKLGLPSEPEKEFQTLYNWMKHFSGYFSMDRLLSWTSVD